MFKRSFPFLILCVADNPHYNTPAVPIADVGKQEHTKDDSSLPLGSVTNLVLILVVIFCTIVIVLSISCTTYAGWKRQKHMDAEGREDSGLTTGFRSSASGHSIEPSARCLAKSGSSASELSNYSNNKRGCPDGRYIDRSSLYMVKDETGMTYLPESNLSSPSHCDEGSKQLVTIPEDRIPPNPYEEGQDHEEDVARYEVGLPYHLGPGSVGELSDRHTVRSDANTADLSMRSVDKRSSQGSYSVRGSQSSMLDSHTGTGYSSRSHRSGSAGSMSRSFDKSDSSLSRKYRGDPLSPVSPQEGDFRVLEGSENPDVGRSLGARRKRKSSPSGNGHSHRSSHHNRNSYPSHQNSHRSHHRSHHTSDSNRRRRKHDQTIQPELSQRPRVVGESPTTQGPSNLYKPSRMSFHEDQDSRPSPVAENNGDLWDHRRRSKPRHHHADHEDDGGDKTPTPTSAANAILNFGYSANLGPREPIWPGKSPSTECPSDTNSRESKSSPNSSNQNKIETTADIEQPPSDAKHKKHGKHKSKKSRHKRSSKSSKSSSGGSAEDDPKLASRLANHSNGYLDEDKTDVQSESAHSDPFVTSPLHYSYLSSKQRPDYMKSVFISDESLARTHSGQDSNHTSRTATPSMSHRKMPDTPTLSSGPSSPSKSLVCVPVYSDADGTPDGTNGGPSNGDGSPPETNGKPVSSVAPLADLDAFEFDELSPVHVAPVAKPKHLQTGTNLYKKPEKSETEKEELVKIESEKDHSPSQANKDSITNGANGVKPAAVVRRTRPRRGPLSAASLV